MKFIDEFRNKDLVRRLVRQIQRTSKKAVSFMEVCGGHTMAIRKFGIPSLLPGNIRLMSGPGCPVCVTGRGFIDHLVALARLDDVIIASFGDLIRVPGSSSTLDSEKAAGRDIRIIYSIMDALRIASQNPGKRIVFPGIGFETTAPGTAAGILAASRQKINNFFVLSSHKIMPPVMEALVEEGVMLDGYISPGHVSTITGSGIYKPLAGKYGKAVVISGFEPVDILQSVYMLVRQVEDNNPSVEIQYGRVVREEGNLKAKKIMEEVFSIRDDWWRGLGVLKGSGLGIREKYARYDAGSITGVKTEPLREDAGCICGEILKGVKTPADCKLFGRVCTPADPVGTCMVSPEGACFADYKYSDIKYE